MSVGLTASLLISVSMLGLVGSANANGSVTPADTPGARVSDRSARSNVISVDVRLRGDAPPGASFTVRVACSVDRLDPPAAPVPVQTLTFPATGGIHDFVVSKRHRNCTVRETDDGGATSVTYQATSDIARHTNRPNNVNIRFAPEGSQQASVAVIIRYPDATPDNVLTITKGPNSALTGYEVAASTVRVDCNNNANTILRFGPGLPTTQEIKVPATGAGTCTVVQTESDLVTGWSYRATSDNPLTDLSVSAPPTGPAAFGFARVGWPTVVNPQGDEAQVTIFDTLFVHEDRFHYVRIKSRIRGTAPADASFQVRVRCSSGSSTGEQIVTITDRTPTYASFPYQQAYCVIHQTDNGGADTVEYSAWSPTAQVVNRPNSALVEFPVNGNATATVKVTNTFRRT